MKRTQRKRKLKVTFYIVFILIIGFAGTSEIFQLTVTALKQESPTKVSVTEKVLDKPQITNDSPHLLLVNKDNPLSNEYQVELKELDNGVKSVASSIYDDLKAMLTAGKEQGLSFLIASGFRSAERQQEILDKDIRDLTRKGMSAEDAYNQVTRSVMPAGYSEHETGLAVDIVALDNQRLDETQQNTAESKWLRKNCAQFGFILRYPEGKEEITGVDFESWHFRYVGKEAAKTIMEKGITLEEYLETK